MNTATAILRKEHDTILRVLDATEEVARQLDRGEPVAPETLTRLLEFFRQFAEQAHLGKEEGLLFPLLEKKGMSRTSVPIGMMMAEHQQGRLLLKLMDELADAYSSGSAEAGYRWAETARIYTVMLRFHIEVENKVLFLMAESLLTEDEQEELAATFEQKNENEQEKEEEKSARGSTDSTYLWIG